MSDPCYFLPTNWVSFGLNAQTRYPTRRRAALQPMAVVLIALFHASGLTAAPVKVPAPQAPSAESLQALIDRAAADDLRLPGVLLAVYSPSHGLDWQGASGYSAIGSTRRLDPAQAFSLASVTKAFTAATVLCLAEQGQLTLTDPIDARVSSATSALLRQGGYICCHTPAAWWRAPSSG